MNQGLPLDFEQQIDQGHTAWTMGKFTEAVKHLTPMMEVAHLNPGAFVDNERGSAAVQKGLIALALSHNGIGDESAARATIGEILRTFPNEKMSAGTYGMAANKLFESVRLDLAGRGKGRLVIKPANAGGVVYLNERIDGVGTRTKDQLLPGEYRVMLQTGAQISRSHTVKLAANEDLTLTVDGGFDDAVRTKADWTGLGFASAADREKSEASYAATFGKSINATAVALIGIDVSNGRPSVIAALVKRDTGGELRRASIPLDASPSRDQLRGLARFLAGEDAGPGIEIHVAKPAKPEARVPDATVTTGEPAEPERPAEQPTTSGRWGGWKWMAS
nr:hypothetical protein [Deltaproteobacteria bacterium]